MPAAERNKLTIQLQFKPDDKSMNPADLRLSVMQAGEKLPLPVDERGRALVVPNPKWMSEDVKLWTNVPKGTKTAIGYSLSTAVPESLQWNYATVMRSVAQSNAVIGKVAGAFSLFAPTIKVAVLRFAKPAQLTIQSKSGVKSYASDAKHTIRLKADDALLKENPLVTVTERALEAELAEE